VEFEHWLDTERDELEWLYHGAPERLAKAAAAGGDLAESVRRWRLRLARTPTDARVALQLMRRLVHSGDRAGDTDV
jgi:DNA-binding SARP family transcriptional activator